MDPLIYTERVRSRTIKRITGTDVIEVRYAGEITYAYRLGTLDGLEVQAPPDGFPRLLINYTSAWPASKSEPRATAMFGARLAHLPLAKEARIAVVNAPDGVNSQTRDAFMPAGYLYRQFVDRETAIAWLVQA
jgi:hypothetical protein